MVGHICLALTRLNFMLTKKGQDHFLVKIKEVWSSCMIFSYLSIKLEVIFMPNLLFIVMFFCRFQLPEAWAASITGGA